MYSAKPCSTRPYSAFTAAATYLGSVRGDNAARSEALLSADGGGAAEVEFASLRAFDLVAALEVLHTVPIVANAAVPIEETAAARSDAAMQLETTGRLIIDRSLAAENLATARTDHRFPFEALPSVRRDGGALVEVLAASRSDAWVQFEVTALARRDAAPGPQAGSRVAVGEDVGAAHVDHYPVLAELVRDGVALAVVELDAHADSFSVRGEASQPSGEASARNSSRVPL